MTVKIAMLKSGEDIIADIKEIVEQNDKIVGYHLENPYVVRLYEKGNMLLTEEATQKLGYDILFSPWVPLSSDKKFVIPFDWIVTIYEPHKDVIISYNEKMEIK